MSCFVSPSKTKRIFKFYLNSVSSQSKIHCDTIRSSLACLLWHWKRGVWVSATRTEGSFMSMYCCDCCCSLRWKPLNTQTISPCWRGAFIQYSPTPRPRGPTSSAVPQIKLKPPQLVEVRDYHISQPFEGPHYFTGCLNLGVRLYFKVVKGWILGWWGIRGFFPCGIS